MSARMLYIPAEAGHDIECIIQALAPVFGTPRLELFTSPVTGRVQAVEMWYHRDIPYGVRTELGIADPTYGNIAALTHGRAAK